MIEIGRICVKIAGRDAGKTCVIVDVLDEIFVMIDGSTRRRKCNVCHLVPLKQKIEIKKNASHEDIAKEFKTLGFEVWTTKPKKSSKRPRKSRKGKTADEKEAQIKAKKAKFQKREQKEPSKKEESIENAVKQEENKIAERTAAKEEKIKHQEKSFEKVKETMTKKNEKF